MEQSQKFAFARKKYYFVAGLPNRFVPNSVLLFEPRICYPALRVIFSMILAHRRGKLRQRTPRGAEPPQGAMLRATGIGSSDR